jgi:hypothetical protein
VNTENLGMTIKYYYGIVESVSDNNAIDVRLKMKVDKYNNLLLLGVSNKSNSILEIGDKVLLGALEDNFINVFIAYNVNIFKEYNER